MKNLFQGKTHVLLAVAMFLLAAVGCTGDKSLCELLPGEWEVTSFVSDGDELMGNGTDQFSAFTMKFDGSGGCDGDLDWTLVSDLGEEDFDGEYSIDEAAKEVMLTIDGDPAVFELTLDDDNLTIDGSPDGEDVVIKAKRK